MRLLLLTGFAIIAFLIALISAYRTAQTSEFYAEQQTAENVQTVVREIGRERNDNLVGRPEKDKKVPPHIREILEKYQNPLMQKTAIALHGTENVSAGFCTYVGASEATIFNQNLSAEEMNFVENLCRQPITDKFSQQDFSDTKLFAATIKFDETENSIVGAFAVRSLPKNNLLSDRFNFLTQGFLLVSVVGLTIFSLLTLRDFGRGMKKIERGLQKIPHDLSTRIETPKISELAEVSREINRLAENLEMNLYQREELEKDLAQSEKLAALGRVASGVAHEIRNPLAAMKLKIQLAERNKQDAEKLSKTFAVLNEEIKRLDGIVSKMLDAGRLKKLNLQTISPTAILCERLEIIKEKADLQNVEIQTELSAEEFSLKADAEKLAQVFENLLLNAFEAMPDGGVLKISETADEDKLVYEFSDTGAGVAASEKEKIFEPFFTTKDKGTGLGLAISREIIEAHGGKLFLKNTQNGAKFVLELKKNIL